MMNLFISVDFHLSSYITFKLVYYMTIHCQAQAQECILEKSMMDNRKSSITAKIAAQIAEYYQSAIRTLDVPNVSNALGSRRCKVMHLDW